MQSGALRPGFRKRAFEWNRAYPRRIHLTLLSHLSAANHHQLITPTTRSLPFKHLASVTLADLGEWNDDRLVKLFTPLHQICNRDC